MTRDRGHYGPIDRDRHWIASWAADEAAGQVRDRTVGAALRPVLPIASDVFAAGRGAGRVWTATRGIGGRVEAEKPAAQIGQELLHQVVGQELFHTVADRERAIAQISTAFKALASDLAVWQTSNADKPDATTTAQWLAADVTPALEEWADFVSHEQKSWWTKMATSWETFEGWHDRVKQLRALARAHGVVLQSAEPLPLPKTIWQKSEEGKGSEATAIIGVLKIGALTALGIIGAAGLYSAVRNLGARARSTDEREAMRQVVREELRAERRPKK
jgi:hypothetical protein